MWGEVDIDREKIDRRDVGGTRHIVRKQRQMLGN